MQPEKILSSVTCQATEMSLMYHTITKLSTEEPPRNVYLRPSALPICSLTLLDGMLNYMLEEPGERDYSMDFFTSVGTLVHEIIEKWAADSGYMLWGNWKCGESECGHEWQYTHDRVCPKCGSNGTYQEIEISFGGFKGHIDLILITPLGVLIGDYKTSTRYKISNVDFGKYNIAYALQVFCYSYMMERVWGQHFQEHYNVGIRGCSLLFISRDNPFDVREFHWKYPDYRSMGKSIVYRGKLSDKAAKHYISTSDLAQGIAGDLAKAVRFRLCKNSSDYATRVGKFFSYDPCHLKGMCFKKDKTELIENYSNKVKLIAKQR